MSRVYDPAAAASLLAEAWRGRGQLAELPEGIRPRDLSEGYDVQERLLDEMGQESAGWKLGIASRNAIKQAGIDRPVAGRVLAPSCVRSGDTVGAAIGAPVTLEFEIAFVLGDDVAPGEAPADLMEIVSSTCVTFELVQSHFVDFRKAGLPSFAADNAGFMALVIGEDIDPDRIAELHASASVSVDGKERARVRSGDDLIDPLESLAGLTRHARERGITLRRGEIVSTGSLTAPFDLAGPKAEIVASFLDSSLRVTLTGS